MGVSPTKGHGSRSDRMPQTLKETDKPALPTPDQTPPALPQTPGHDVTWQLRTPRASDGTPWATDGTPRASDGTLWASDGTPRLIIIIIIKLYLYSTFHAKECSSKCFTANT